MTVQNRKFVTAGVGILGLILLLTGTLPAFKGVPVNVTLLSLGVFCLVLGVVVGK